MIARAPAASPAWDSRALVRRGLPRPIRRFLRHRPAVLAAALIGVYLLTALLAPVIAPYNPLDTSAGPRLYPPNVQNWFGTDEFGRDVFSRVVYGARIAFTVGVSAATSSRTIVPLPPSSSRPSLRSTAPVNAPRSWPKSSLSTSCGGRLAQSIFRKGASRRGPASCTNRAR